VSLQDNPKYEALSYCWGDKSDPATIKLQDRPFEVGKNLYRALIRLRREQEARTLWIDAICINQKDILERAQQVELMGELYSITTNCNIYGWANSLRISWAARTKVCSSMLRSSH